MAVSKKSVWALLFALLCVFSGVGVRAQTPNQFLSIVYQNFNISNVGGTPWLALNGQGVCSITFVNAPASATIVVQGASDAPTSGTRTPVTITSIGSAGTITNPAAGSQFGGSVVPYALTYFSLNFTAISGQATGSITCSYAGNGSGGSSSGGGSGGSSSVIACVINTSNPVVCKASAGTYLGFENNADTAQTVTVHCYNNATTPTGTYIATIAPPGLSQYALSAGGDYFSAGLTCQATGTPNTNGTGTGILIKVQ